MKENKTNETASEQAGSSTDGDKQNNKSTNQSGQSNQNNNANANNNSPDWLMHLLTGAGALGGNYLLFIKPLQEKFDAMAKAIQSQEEMIEELQEQMELLLHKQKKKNRFDDEDELEQNDDDLFTVKSKPQKQPPAKAVSGIKKKVRF